MQCIERLPAIIAAGALALAPVLALAEPSANLSVNVVPAQTVGIPAAAAAAGFSTLAQNWDFSQPTYNTLSNWYDCDGSRPDLIWHQGNPGVPLTNPCNLFQTNDGGNTVLDVQYLTAYNNNTHQWSGQFNQVGGQTTSVYGDRVSLDFPNMYIETTARIARSDTTAPANSGGPSDVWTWDDGPDHHLEIDVFELYADQGGFGNGGTSHVHWFSYANNNLPAGWKPTDYHKYGALLTSDGATGRNVCMFVDDILQSCGDEDAANFNIRNRMIIAGGSNSANTDQNLDLLIQDIKVYSCASWATEMCNGTTKVNVTRNGQNFVYWK